MANYKTGPLAGIDYKSERAKRDAREYFKKTGIALKPETAVILARGSYAAAQKTRERNREFFAVRTAQQMVGRDGGDVREVARDLLKRDSDWSKAWRKAAHSGFEPGQKAFDQLLHDAGMNTDYGNNGRTHYEQYVKMKWDELDALGEKSADDVFDALAATGS